MKKILITLVLITILTGCTIPVYVRDMYSQPVENAEVLPSYWSILTDGKPPLLTDSEGYTDVSFFPFGIEAIEVSKEGYHTIRLNQYGLGDELPYIIVLVPSHIEYNTTYNHIPLPP